MFESLGLSNFIEEHIYGDIRDLNALSSAVQATQPAIVIHMAAQSLVRESYENPVETYTTNVIGTVNLLEAVREITSAKVVLNITTDKCYENKEWLWGYRENDVLGGYDPYSNSKACAELVSSSYRKSFFSENQVSLPTARAGNVIGGGDWSKDRIVPDAIRSFMNNECLQVRYPEAIRPWQHVLEPLGGYLMLCQNAYQNTEKYSEGWNFGPSQQVSVSVRNVVDTLVEFWGEGAKWGTDNDSHPHEALTLKLDCSKANMFLNWKPIWGVSRTFEETVNWYLAYRNNEDMLNFTKGQILNYQNEYNNERVG